MQRAQAEKDGQFKFARQSTKYGKNPIFSDNYVGVPWRVLQTTQTPKARGPVQLTAVEQNWKGFESFEGRNEHDRYKQKIADDLKYE